jgi:hypothetical protein
MPSDLVTPKERAAPSLGGYVTGPQDSVDAPMGIGGFRLFNWLDRRNDGAVAAGAAAGRAARRAGTARRTGPAPAGATALADTPTTSGQLLEELDRVQGVGVTDVLLFPCTADRRQLDLITEAVHDRL